MNLQPAQSSYRSHRQQ